MKTSNEIMEVFKKLNKQGTTVIIMHDMEVAKVCDKIIEILDEKIVSGF